MNYLEYRNLLAGLEVERKQLSVYYMNNPGNMVVADMVYRNIIRKIKIAHECSLTDASAVALPKPE